MNHPMSDRLRIAADRTDNATDRIAINLMIKELDRLFEEHDVMAKANAEFQRRMLIIEGAVRGTSRYLNNRPKPRPGTASWPSRTASEPGEQQEGGTQHARQEDP